MLIRPQESQSHYYMTGWNEYHAENPKAPWPGNNVGAGIEQGVKSWAKDIEQHPVKDVVKAVAGAVGGVKKAGPVEELGPLGTAYAAVKGAVGAMVGLGLNSFRSGYVKGSTSWN